MNGEDIHHSLQFHYYRITDQQVNPTSAVKPNALVSDGQFHLAAVLNPTQVQLVAQTLFVHRFKQTRSQGFMNFDGSTNDLRCYVFMQ